MRTYFRARGVLPARSRCGNSRLQNRLREKKIFRKKKGKNSTLRHLYRVRGKSQLEGIPKSLTTESQGRSARESGRRGACAICLPKETPYDLSRDGSADACRAVIASLPLGNDSTPTTLLSL
jgi:hypothetical protein